MPHKWGQVLLRDGNMIAKILRTADVSATDHVVEIGCGDGSLSLPLAETAAHLDIIEIDPDMVARLTARLDPKLPVSIHQGDILERQFHDVSATPFRIIANLPYYITTKIIKAMIENRHRISDAIVMVQDEFAQKLTAVPRTKHYVSLTLYTSFYFDVKRCFKVPKQCFQPIPKVDSAIIRLMPRLAPFSVDEDQFFTLIRAGFATRRKRLVNCLMHDSFWAQFDWNNAPMFLKSPNCRAEELDLNGFYELYRYAIPSD